MRQFSACLSSIAWHLFRDVGPCVSALFLLCICRSAALMRPVPACGGLVALTTHLQNESLKCKPHCCMCLCSRRHLWICLVCCHNPENGCLTRFALSKRHAPFSDYSSCTLVSHRRKIPAAPAHLLNGLPAAREASAEQFKDTANAFFKKGDYAQAVKGYSRAIQACPNNPKYYNNRAAARLKVSSCVGVELVELVDR